jgi:hypothetical protein
MKPTKCIQIHINSIPQYVTIYDKGIRYWIWLINSLFTKYPIMLNCDIIHYPWIYIRTNSRCGTLQLFIPYNGKGYNWSIRMAIWKYGIDVSIDPFNKHIHISIGKRFSDYFFIQWYIRHSKHYYSPLNQ